MRYFKISVMTIIAYIIQIGVLSRLRIFGIVPDFVVAMLICFSLKEENFLTAGIFGAVFGLLLDASSGAVMGLHGILCMYLSILCSLLGTKFLKGKFSVSMIFVYLLSIIYESVYYVFGFGMWHDVSFVYCFLHVILPAALFNTIAAAIVYIPIKKA